MLKISAQTNEPYWVFGADIKPEAVALPGVNIQVRPITVAMRLAAREAVREAYRVAGDDPLARFDAEAAYARALARYGIVAWQGVADADEKELEVTPENVDLAMANEAFYSFVERMYVLQAIATESEKNVSAPSPNGTGGAKTPGKATAATVRHPARNAPTE
jgi:hypothetical protein